jgi:Right handed beta helix region/Purple acid Phosphatase, N-terminal domain
MGALLLSISGSHLAAQDTLSADSVSRGQTGGQVYYVAPWGNDRNSGSLDAPWATLSHVSYSLQAGETLVLRGGIYPNDHLTVPSGVSSQQQPITVVAYPGEVPAITGSGSYGTVMNVHSPMVINGVTFLRSDVNDVVDLWSSDVTVQNCTFKESGGQFIRINGVNNITIQNNVFDTNGYIDTDGEDDAIAILGASNILIQNNYATRNGHYFADAVYNSGFGPSKNIVLRDNTIDQHWGGAIAETGQGSQNMLIEGNRISHVGEGVAYVKTGFELNASNNIVRNNIVTAVAGWYGNNGLVLTGQYNIKDSSSENNRIYNNVFYNIGYLPIYLSQRQHSDNDFNYVTNNKIVNNILFDNETQGAMFYRPAAKVYVLFDTYHSPNNPWPFFPYNNYLLNNIIGDNPGDNDLFQYNTPTTYHEWAMGSVQSNYSGYVSGNLQADPEFVNAAGGDFRLSASSPAIDAGAHLAHTTASGTSATIPVDDAYFFTNGFGIVGGDSIKVGHNAPVTVTAVNYQGKTLTLNAAVSFNRGDAVDLANYSGAAPDLGAFAYSSTPSGIYGVAALPQNGTSAAVSWNTTQNTTGQVEYGPTSAYEQTSLVNFTPSTTHNITVAGLQPGTTYHYAVISTTPNGGRSVSPDYTFTTPRAPGPVIATPSVSNLDLTASGTSATAKVTISWTTDEPTTGQVVYNSGGWHATYFHASAISNATRSTSHSVTLTGLVPNSTYHYAVQNTDAADNTSYSHDYTFTTPAVSAPGPVISQVSVNATSGATGWFAAPGGHGYAPSGKNCCGYSFSQATISWRTNVATTSNKVQLMPISIGGDVETVSLNSSTQAAVSGNPAATTAPALTIYQLAPSTTYEYRVQSTDSQGRTTTSPTLTFTTPAVD